MLKAWIALGAFCSVAGWLLALSGLLTCAGYTAAGILLAAVLWRGRRIS